MDDPDELLARDAHYRELAAYITDSCARAGILKLATQYDRQAAETEADDRGQSDAAG